MSIRGEEWSQFADEVLQHIEVYTVTQYGDKGRSGSRGTTLYM